MTDDTTRPRHLTTALVGTLLPADAPDSRMLRRLAGLLVGRVT
jgi:hypothetical protein